LLSRPTARATFRSRTDAGSICRSPRSTVVHPDGSGLKTITPHGGFCGSPKWTADSKRVVAYCMTAEQTLDNRRPIPEHPEDTRIISVDIATGEATDLPAGRGVKFNPSPLAGNLIGYIKREG
jgi:hypothetical protein